MALGADGTFLEYHFHIFELAKKKKSSTQSLQMYDLYFTKERVGISNCQVFDLISYS